MADIVVKNVEWTLFFGCLLIAFGPVAASFFTIVSKKAQLVVIAITSAFFWLTSILVTSLIWYIIPPLKDSIEATVILGVLIQELFRFFMFLAYSKAEKSILKVTTPQAKLPLNDITSSFAAGIGFAAMQSTMLYGSILASSLSGKGAAFSTACDSLPTIFVSALITLAFTIVNVALMIVAFDSFRKTSIPGISFVLFVHFGGSIATLFNTQENGCYYSIPLSFLAAIVSIAGSIYVLKKTSQFTPLQ